MSEAVILAWMAAFVAVQVALFFAAGRARQVVAPRPPKSWGVLLLQWGLGTAALLLMIAVLLPVPHGRNWESGALGHLRTISSSQAAYLSVTEGVYGRPDCLVRIATCVPGYGGPMILPLQELSTERLGSLGYEFTFYPGRPATSRTGVKGYETWAYVAVPGTRAKGRRSFCLDETGFIGWAPPGQPIVVSGGACPKLEAVN